MKIKAIISLLLSFSLLSSYAYDIQFKDKTSKENIPVFLINITDQTVIYSDLDGRVSLSTPLPLIAQNFGYNPLKIIPKKDTTYFLERAFNSPISNDPAAKTIIEHVFQHKKLNDPENNNGFSFD